MNNLQRIVKDDTRFAMHMAVELCEQGDFDSVTEAFKWLSQECDGAALGGECEQVLVDCDDDLMPPFTAHCSKCGTEWGFTPKFCPECGAKVTGTRDERRAVKR